MLNPVKRVGFTATSPRFTHNQVFFGQSLKYTPGPGDYLLINGARPKTFSHSRGKISKNVFASNESKFKSGNNSYISNRGTTNLIGPGSYINTD